MIDEKEWMSDRARIIGKNKTCRILQYICFFWFSAFIIIVIFFKLGRYLDVNSLFLWWVVPPLVISIPSFIMSKFIPETDIITYHLYNISKNLRNLGEIDTAEKEMSNSLKALDDVVQNNEFDTQLFTKNIEDTLYRLLESLECLNTYIKRKKKPKEFNNQVASAIKSIADLIRKDDSKITDEFSKAIQLLYLNFENVERTKIRMPLHRYTCEVLIKWWNKLPNIINMIILSILIAMGVWFIPEKIGLSLSQDTKAGVIALFILPVANHYLKR